MATDKNALRPRWDAIEPAFPEMSPGEQVFLAHVLTFVNSGSGGWPVATYLAAIPNVSVGDAASKLDGGRRAALAALIVSYEGWWHSHIVPTGDARS